MSTRIPCHLEFASSKFRLRLCAAWQWTGSGRHALVGSAASAGRSGGGSRITAGVLVDEALKAGSVSIDEMAIRIAA